MIPREFQSAYSAVTGRNEETDEDLDGFAGGGGGGIAVGGGGGEGGGGAGGDQWMGDELDGAGGGVFGGRVLVGDAGGDAGGERGVQDRPERGLGDAVGDGGVGDERGGELDDRAGAHQRGGERAGQPDLCAGGGDEIHVPDEGGLHVVVPVLCDPGDDERAGDGFGGVGRQRDGGDERGDGDGVAERVAERGGDLRAVDDERVREQRAGDGFGGGGERDDADSGAAVGADGEILCADERDADEPAGGGLRPVRAAGEQRGGDELLLSGGRGRAFVRELLAFSDERGAGGGDDAESDESDAGGEHLRLRGQLPRGGRGRRTA